MLLGGHSAYVLKLPSNTRQILDSGHPQQIPLRVSLFNEYDKLPILLGHFLAKPVYQLLPHNPQFLHCDRFGHHPLKFFLEDRAQVAPVWGEDFHHRSGVTCRLLKNAHLSPASRDCPAPSPSRQRDNKSLFIRRDTYRPAHLPAGVPGVAPYSPQRHP